MYHHMIYRQNIYEESRWRTVARQCRNARAVPDRQKRVLRLPDPQAARAALTSLFPVQLRKIVSTLTRARTTWAGHRSMGGGRPSAPAETLQDYAQGPCRTPSAQTKMAPVRQSNGTGACALTFSNQMKYC